MSEVNPRQRQGFVICQVCSVRVDGVNYRRHLRKIHGLTEEDLHVPLRSLDDLLDERGHLIRPPPLEEPSHLARCLHCSSMIRTNRLKQHYLKAHGTSEAPRPPEPRPLTKVAWPIGLKVIDGLGKGIRWRASGTESCPSCGRRIIQLEVEGRKYKAFDVDRDRYIQGAHACDASVRSESVRAVSGGIVDSNRRKH